MDWTSLIAITASLFLIGFFAGIEIAFVSVSKLSIELRKKQGSYTGKTWSAFMEKPARFNMCSISNGKIQCNRAGSIYHT